MVFRWRCILTNTDDYCGGVEYLRSRTCWLFTRKRAYQSTLV
jgi:hypothetical protein